MKKLLWLLMLLLLCAPAMAAEQVVIPLADGALSFDAFEDGYVLTRETSASVFNRVGLSQREVIPWMEENDLYALMYDADMSCEVQIEILEVTQPDYNDITPEQDAEMLDSFTEFYEQYGYVAEASGMYDNGAHRFGWAHVTMTYDDGYVENRIHYRTCHHDYMIEMVMFVYDGSHLVAYEQLARELVDSMRYTLQSGVVQIGLADVSVQLLPPSGMTVQPAADIQTIPEDGMGEIIGCMADPAEEWFIVWHLDESASGDLDRLSNAGVRSLYQAREKAKRKAGCDVAFAEDYAQARQRYIRLGYSFIDGEGQLWHAVQYYTKQSGWGVSVTAYSCGQPLTEDVQLALQHIIDSQMIVVNGQ